MGVRGLDAHTHLCSTCGFTFAVKRTPRVDPPPKKNSVRRVLAMLDKFEAELAPTAMERELARQEFDGFREEAIHDLSLLLHELEQ